MQEPYAKEIENALNQDLKADFPNAPRLALKPTGGARPTAKHRLDTSIADLEAQLAEFEKQVADLKTICAALRSIQDRI